MNGRFLINRGDAKVMGVAAGLADYTGVDPTLIRLGFVAPLAHRPRDDLLLCPDGAAGAASNRRELLFPPTARGA